MNIITVIYIILIRFAIHDLSNTKEQAEGVYEVLDRVAGVFVAVIVGMVYQLAIYILFIVMCASIVTCIMKSVGWSVFFVIQSAIGAFFFVGNFNLHGVLILVWAFYILIQMRDIEKHYKKWTLQGAYFISSKGNIKPLKPMWEVKDEKNINCSGHAE